METKFNITRTKKGDATLTVQGELLVHQAGTFQSHLKELMSEKGELHISLKDVKSIDASAIQLLSSFKKAVKKTISVTLPESKEVYDLLENTNLRQIL